MAQIILQESAAPSTPSTGNVSVYAKTDGKLYSKDDAGSESGFIGSVEIQSQFVTAFTTGGTSTAYTLTTSPVLSALTTNECYKVTFHTASGATPTMARDGLTAKLLKQYDSAGAKVTAIVATGQISDVVYDGTDYVVLSKLTNIAGTVSMVRLNTTNGYGSTNTKIRRFTNVVTNQGSDITYADSAALGASFTINANGVYAITYVDVFSSAADCGLSLNTTTPTTSISAISATESLSESTGASANFAVQCGWTGYLPQGSIVRPHTSGVSTGTSHPQTFTITRVA